MKKTILFLVFSIALSSSLFAQKDLDKKVDKKVNAYIEIVESKLPLSTEEKKTLVLLKKAHVKATFEINEKYEKGTAALKDKRKANNKKFSKSLSKAFGKERAQEIKEASKKDKTKKKKKKN